MISQLTVFLANERGRLAAACRTLADAGFNMHSLVLADTADFGVVRIFCDRPDEAAALLVDAGYRAAVTPVIAVRVPNEPGGLATRPARTSSTATATPSARMGPSTC